MIGRYMAFSMSMAEATLVRTSITDIDDNIGIIEGLWRFNNMKIKSKLRYSRIRTRDPHLNRWYRLVCEVFLTAAVIVNMIVQDSQF